MSLPTRKNLFFALFSVLLLLSFLLSETYVGLYVLGAFSLTLLLFHRTFPAKKTVNSTVVLLSFLFLAACGLSLISSISFPLSLYGLIRYVFLLIFFIFFLKTDFSKEDKNTFFHLLLFQGISLVFVSALFFFLPEYGNKIPGMNLIFSTYGHNHLGAIMLLLNPIAFWLYLTENKRRYLLLVGLFSAAMLFSFGRVVIFLGLIQVGGLMAIAQQRAKFSLRTSRGIFLTAIVLLFGVGLALYVRAGQSGRCLVDIEDAAYREQVCKTDLRKNARSFYWQQAWDAFVTRPIFGYGIGTFGSISYQYRQIPELRSSYAHNDYLQIFAEGGVVAGGLFLFLLGYLYWGTWNKLKDSQHLVLFLSVAMIGVDFFFDFDLNFLGIALTTFLLFGLLFDSPRPFKRLITSRQLQTLVTMIFIGLVLVAGVYGLVDQLVAADKEGIAYQIFPFFHWHSLSFMKSDQLSKQQKIGLAQVYWASPTVGAYWVNSLEDEEKAVAEYQSWQGDPWRKMTSFLPQYYLDKKDTPALEKVLVETRDFLADKRNRFGFQRESIPYADKAEWAKGFLFLAEKKVENKQYALAGQYIHDAFYFDEWSIATTNPVFSEVRQQAVEPVQRPFLAPLNDIPAQYFGDNRNQVSRLYFDQTLDLLESGADNTLMQQSAQRSIELAEWNVGWFHQEIFFDDFLWSQLVAQQAWNRFFRSVLVFHALQTHQFQDDSYYEGGHYRFFTQRLLKPLQQYLDAQLAQDNQDQAEQLLDTVTQGMGGMYWLQAQRGYFYGVIGNEGKAKQAFEECLAANPAHEDCQHGLENLTQKGYPDLRRYQEIRQILLAL